MHSSPSHPFPSLQISHNLDFYCCCSVTKPCLILCNPMDCSTLGFPDLHYLLEFAQTHGHWVGDAIQPSHPLSSPSPPALNLSRHQDLFQSWLFSSGGQSIGPSASASVLPMNIQNWSLLGLTGLISLLWLQLFVPVILPTMYTSVN